MENVAIVIGCIVVLGIFVGGIWLAIWDIKNSPKPMTREQLLEMEEKMLNDEGEKITLHAEVVDMTCGVKSIGYQFYKQPKAVKYFLIQFKADDGAVFDIPVLEEMYDGFEIGYAGMLTLVDGQLISFELDNNQVNNQQM